MQYHELLRISVYTGLDRSRIQQVARPQGPALSHIRRCSVVRSETDASQAHGPKLTEGRLVRHNIRDNKSVELSDLTTVKYTNVVAWKLIYKLLTPSLPLDKFGHPPFL